ncbi:hypothetical protein N7468_009225 [Penicillium chermesinum]|uniref:Uncharacterized protein n=1 Tax=Penicillium chermesinum TaxID=63820 RepID=A0A9W9NHE2_9EURO|nr:uncharacterized protein N7468_009225 [Penicillium chermesinum]KAJ5220021.1 hypothetical protein N7468_009225 [Penicillium chermesinum]
MSPIPAIFSFTEMADVTALICPIFDFFAEDLDWVSTGSVTAFSTSAVSSIFTAPLICSTSVSPYFLARRTNCMHAATLPSRCLIKTFQYTSNGRFVHLADADIPPYLNL